MTTPPPTRGELADRLDALAGLMADCGEEMLYVGGFGKTGCRGNDLICMARIVALLALDMRLGIEEKEGQ